jgi:hypothetical protein
VKKKVFLFSVFRNFVPTQYEAWLEKNALNGWHPKNVTQSSSVGMTFIKGEPKQYRYVFDMQFAQDKGYKAIYEAFGWEYVG